MALWQQVSARFIRWLRRHAMAVVILCFASAIVGAYFSFQLYKNLRTDMEELLPNDARSVVDLKKISGRLVSSEQLSVLVFSNHPQQSKRFVKDLAEAIESRLSDQIARVEYNIAREIRFFEKRKALYIDLKDLERIRDFLEDRIQYETEIQNPLNIFSERLLQEPRLDFGKLFDKYKREASDYTKFKDGYYANRDETIRVVMVYMPGKSSGIGAATRLTESVQQIVQELNPRSYSPDLVVKYTGNVANLVEEHASLIKDLEVSTAVVIILVTLVLWMFYRNLLATSILSLSLSCGVLWTFGMSFFAVGYLNANSAFLGAIVIGNGINFGIIVLARYLEERRFGRPHEDALGMCIIGTQKATLTAALAAGLAYGSLVLTGFRGFRQFGIIGLIGMILCWISAYTVLPALLELAERYRPIRTERMGSTHGYFSRGLAVIVPRWPKTIIAASLILLVLSGVAALEYEGQLIETDTSKLRDRRSVESGSSYLTRYLDEIFGRYLSPLVILPSTLKDRKAIEAKLKAYLRRQPDPKLIVKVHSIEDFVPKNQKAKIRVLREIRNLLSPRVFRELSASDRALVRSFLTPEALKPFGPGRLPSAVIERFREGDGSFGKVVLVEPTTDMSLLNIGDYQNKLVSTVREIVDSAAPGTPIAGTLPLTVDMYESIRKDGPKATSFAFVAVMGLLIALFRRPRSVLLASLGLLFGVGWLFGIIFWRNLHINFLNFIALPITFGIGVDYTVNVFQRYENEGRGTILAVLRSTGGAVALASLTTIIGYGSLLMAGNQAFFSFGRLAILGELTSLVAAVVSLPALIHLLDRRREPGVGARGKEELEAETVKSRAA